MKAIKSRGRDWQHLLVKHDDVRFVDELRKRVADDDDAESILVDLILRPQFWRDIDVPWKAAQALAAMGRLGALVEVFTYVIDDWDLEDLDLDMALGRLGLVIGEHGDEAVRDHMLHLLDEALIDEGAPHPAWLNLVEIVVHIAEERGIRSERAWSWLERVREHEEPLWCTYAGGYGDARATPLLLSIVDRFERDDLLARTSYDEDQQLVVEAIASLQALDASRPADDELFKAIRADARARQHGARPVD